MIYKLKYSKIEKWHTNNTGCQNVEDLLTKRDKL